MALTDMFGRELKENDWIVHNHAGSGVSHLYKLVKVREKTASGVRYYPLDPNDRIDGWSHLGYSQYPAVLKAFQSSVILNRDNLPESLKDIP
jgi:hypothetical protein